jgi:hypothetical protein
MKDFFSVAELDAELDAYAQDRETPGPDGSPVEILDEDGVAYEIIDVRWSTIGVVLHVRPLVNPG